MPPRSKKSKKPAVDAEAKTQQQPQKQKEPDASRPPEKKQQRELTAGKPGGRRRGIRFAPARQGGHCVLLSHLPSGLGEPQLRRYLGQFGRVLRVRVPHSARTGGAKGVAFAELADPAAAATIAETLDNYLMFTRLVRCKVLRDPKRLTFAADGRRPKQMGVGAAPAAATPAAAGKRSRRLETKVARLKQLDPGFEFQSA